MFTYTLDELLKLIDNFMCILHANKYIYRKKDGIWMDVTTTNKDGLQQEILKVLLVSHSHLYQ